MFTAVHTLFSIVPSWQGTFTPSNRGLTLSVSDSSELCEHKASSSPDPAAPPHLRDASATVHGKPEEPRTANPTHPETGGAFTLPPSNPADNRCCGSGAADDPRAKDGSHAQSPCQCRGSGAAPAARKAGDFAGRRQRGRVSAPRRRAASRLGTTGGGDGGGRQDEEEEDEHRNDGVGGYDQRQHQRLACPFYKLDPMRFMSCTPFRLSRIRDVKQHLLRRHRQPPYCPVCGNIFKDPESRDIHIMARDCHSPLGGVPVNIEGVTDTQRAALSRRSDSDLDLASQWFRVWEILFPGNPRPLSPYMSTQFGGATLDIIEDYWQRHKDTLVTEVAEVAQSAGASDGQIRRLLAELTSRVIANLFSSFRSTSQDVLDPGPLGPATASPITTSPVGLPAVSNASPTGYDGMDGDGIETASNSTILMLEADPCLSTHISTPNLSSTSSDAGSPFPIFLPSVDGCMPLFLYGSPLAPMMVEGMGTAMAHLGSWDIDDGSGLGMSFLDEGTSTPNPHSMTTSSPSVMSWVGTPVETAMEHSADYGTMFEINVSGMSGFPAPSMDDRP